MAPRWVSWIFVYVIFNEHDDFVHVGLYTTCCRRSTRLLRPFLVVSSIWPSHPEHSRRPSVFLTSIDWLSSPTRGYSTTTPYLTLAHHVVNDRWNEFQIECASRSLSVTDVLLAALWRETTRVPSRESNNCEHLADARWSCGFAGRYFHADTTAMFSRVYLLFVAIEGNRSRIVWTYGECSSDCREINSATVSHSERPTRFLKCKYFWLHTQLHSSLSAHTKRGNERCSVGSA